MAMTQYQYNNYLKSLKDELEYLTDDKRIKEVKKEIDRVSRQLTVMNWYGVKEDSINV